jgi:SAM-dependent methyltransferase
MRAMEHNNAVFDDRKIAAEFEQDTRLVGRFLNAGEQMALLIAANRVRGLPVLDVGAGTGRLAAMMRLLSDEYVAIDYSPNMVAAFQRCHPDLRAEIGDARDLHQFAADTFGLVVFSNNGIDAVDRTERVQVVREMGRVVSASGLVVFSTLNKNGVSYDENPFRLYRRGMAPAPAVRATVRGVANRVLHPMSGPHSVINWRRNKRVARDHGAWAMGALAAHDFAPFVHFTTLGDLRELVSSAGLVIESIWAEDGSSIDAAEPDSTADCFTVVAKRP